MNELSKQDRRTVLINLCIRSLDPQASMNEKFQKVTGLINVCETIIDETNVANERQAPWLMDTVALHQRLINTHQLDDSDCQTVTNVLSRWYTTYTHRAYNNAVYGEMPPGFDPGV